MNNVSRMKFFLFWHGIFIGGLVLCAALPFIVYYFFTPWLLEGTEFGTAMFLLMLSFLLSSLHLILSFVSTEHITGQYYYIKFWRMSGIILVALLLYALASVIGESLGYVIITSSFLAESILAIGFFFYAGSIFFIVTRRYKLIKQRRLTGSIIAFIVPVLLIIGAMMHIQHDRYLIHQNPEQRLQTLVKLTYQNNLQNWVTAIPRIPRVQALCKEPLQFYPSAEFQQTLVGTMDGTKTTIVLESFSNTCATSHVALCNINIDYWLNNPLLLDKYLIVWDGTEHWSFYEKETLISGHGFVELQRRLSANHCHLVTL
jgi:hypothetical protein